MSAPASKSYVAVVDDEDDLVWTTVRRLQQVRPQLEVQGFVDPQVALKSFATRPPDLLITDVRMPHVSGIELMLSVRRAHPATPVIIVTAFGDDTVQRHVLESSGIRYHEKPCETEDLLKSIDTLLAADAGFMGSIEIPQLPDLIQIQNLAKASCILMVERGRNKGTLWFENGEIVHAELGKAIGTVVVYELLGWPGGRFKMQPFTKPQKRTVQESTMELLMEGLRVIDESRRNRAASTNPEPSERVSSGTDIFMEDSVNNVKQCLDEAIGIDGGMAAALVDWKSGMALGTAGAGVNLEVAAAGNTEVVRSKQKVMTALGLKDGIEDILITLGSQYHLIRLLQSKPGLFMYLVLNREKSNLALARHKLADIEARISL